MDSPSTCWSVIKRAAAGANADRTEFARRYGRIVRDYLAARWKSPRLRAHLDDAVQDVFMECFRQGGVLARADAERAGGFRPFLFGVVRNVALRVETRSARELSREPRFSSALDLDALPATEEATSRAFDRAWAKAVVGEAAALQAARAQELGNEAEKRVELLRLRFFEGLPIREIAKTWKADPAALHHEYARARAEFGQALRDVVAFESPGDEPSIDRQCRDLLALLNRS